MKIIFMTWSLAITVISPDLHRLPARHLLQPLILCQGNILHHPNQVILAFRILYFR
ncbi:hypothetical protein UYSO10_5098 [Kosakonia radicincitans]|nr:hypothetical protein UYSO10_5098 [Kosakonia radicincitans]